MSDTGFTSLSVPSGSGEAYSKAAGWRDFYISGVSDPISGSCGANLTWAYDVASATLTISGTGEMQDYTEDNSAPWHKLRAKMRVVKISDGVTSIGDWAFADCFSIISVDIGNSVAYIKNNAFFRCRSLTTINVKEGNPYFSSSSDGVLFNKDKTTLVLYPVGKHGDYEIPAGVYHIGNGAFLGCTSLTSVTIPDGVISIGDRAFWGCTSLTTIIIPNSVDFIGNSAFNMCTGLVSVTIGENVTTIGYYAFASTSLVNIYLPSSVKEIGSSAFANNASLIDIDISLDNIYFSSVDGVLFNSDQTILKLYPTGRQGAYIIPEGVIVISEGAFSSSTLLTTITIPGSVASIGNEAFFGCSSLANIEVAPDNPNFSSVDGVLFDKNLTTLIRYPEGKQGEYTIPDGVIDISESVFSGNVALTSVTIPNSVKTIGDLAFSGCSFLTTVNIGNNVETIGDRAFSGCTALTSIIIPNSVTSIGDMAFFNCVSLLSVTIGNSVKTIGSSAFEGCTSLQTLVSMRIDPPTVLLSTFNDVDLEECRLYVLPEARIHYVTTEVWEEFFFVLYVGVNSDLATLSISEGTLSPGFNAQITSYNGVVSAHVATLTIAATTQDVNATVTGTGEKSLVPGINIFHVVVTAQNRINSKTYTIGIERHDSSVGSVISVEIIPDITLIQLGTARQFTANVTTHGEASTDVTWSVSDNTRTETNIDTNGLLSVAANETATTLTITATSVFDDTKHGTAIATLTHDPVTNIAEITNIMLTRIYPNPTVGTINLEFEIESVYSVTLTDMGGRILLREIVTGQTAQIDVGIYPVGVYLLTIDDGKKQTTMRVVKE
jgi:hypothetical protein